MDLDAATLALVNQVARLRMNDANDSKLQSKVVVRIESLQTGNLVKTGANVLCQSDELEQPSDRFPSPSFTPSICTVNKWITCHFDAHSSSRQNIEAFVNRWRPSCTTLRDGEWIAVNRGMTIDPNPPRIEEMKASFQNLVRSHRQNGNITLTTSALDKLAQEYNVTSGKWIIFTDRDGVDTAWAEIIKLICLYRKRGFAKVSVEKGDNNHAICVYVDAFSDEREVFRLRNDLKRNGIVQKIAFKLDAYSHLGIYRKNVWGISPRRYYQ
ncbi:translation initiation factor eIF 4e-like domain-containing protein [Rhodocollybia butyracea]|uniref:Translation initiation factor eIF 4e-like domain-containing protein n=1 Tax=Rhodocollybia butyracea TaxID=206335 RepID=A0A9P5Q7J7_9AGAR|nr:translation initiation factor eIF 4e-like domain-containing protein [Rhodocollybia butyracea]